MDELQQRNGKIEFKNNIRVSEKEMECPWDIEKTIEIQGEVKIFAKKFAHSEAECVRGAIASKGDDIGFTLVYGNYGEFCYEAPRNKPTVEDQLYIQSPVSLKLMSLCINDENARLFNVNSGTVVQIGDVFEGGRPYQLQVQKLNNMGRWIADFDIECHSICCISMLFQIEFPICKDCRDRRD
ncbi:hypothetical protein [uncultured Clostridium sp.]|uniref:hypothetical protein n=1 Tax=uncultured Clostridium sp. TaxID=59620 RepID=UPI0026084AF2|nr:hypothetical protein [uncultured Clostridium sp.]